MKTIGQIVDDLFGLPRQQPEPVNVLVIVFQNTPEPVIEPYDVSEAVTECLSMRLDEFCRPSLN